MTKESRDIRDKFLKKMEKHLPEELSQEDVIKIITTILLTYADDQRAAGEIVMAVTRITQGFYRLQNGGECPCDDCIAERKAAAH